MAKIFPTIFTLFLILLFLITACTPQEGGIEQETTVGGTPAGSDIAPSKTTAEVESESTSEEISTVPEYFETFSPERREKYLQQLEDDPDMRAFREKYPEIFDVDFLYCVSSDIFNPIIAELNGGYITLDEMIKIVGKPHLRCNLRVSYTIYYWVTSDNKMISAWLKKTSNAPKEATFIEKSLYYYGYELLNLSVSLEEYPNKPTATGTSETTAEPDVEMTTTATPETTKAPRETVSPINQ